MSKILIIGPAWIGDMVMAQSLFKLLKKGNPQVEIDVLAPEWSLPILARMPEVTSSMIMPFEHGQLKLGERFRLGKSLRDKKYSQAIVLPNSFKSALVPFFAKIPKRTGWKREFRSLILNDTRKLDEKRYPLMVEQYLALGLERNAVLPSTYPLPELTTSSVTRAELIVKYGLKVAGRSILIICPGAEFGSAKRWSEGYYADLANEKLAEGWDIWMLGSQKDMPVAEAIMQLTQDRCVNLTGKTSLEEAVDLITLATAVVSNDSGLMHIAAALHKPLIVIYGSTSPKFTPPLNNNAKVLTLNLECQPCFQRECPLKHHRCMTQLIPKKVNEALNEVIK